MFSHFLGSAWSHNYDHCFHYYYNTLGIATAASSQELIYEYKKRTICLQNCCILIYIKPHCLARTSKNCAPSFFFPHNLHILLISFLNLGQGKLQRLRLSLPPWAVNWHKIISTSLSYYLSYEDMTSINVQEG